MEECYLSACSLRLTQFAFYTTRDHLTGSGAAHSGLCLPISIINQENGLIDYADGGVVPVNVPSSQRNLACVKLTKTSQFRGSPRSAFPLVPSRSQKLPRLTHPS